MAAPNTPGSRIRAQRGDTSWKVRADSLDALRELAVASVGTAAITHLDLEVASWTPPFKGWLGNLGLAGVVKFRVDASGPRAVVELDLAAALDVGIVLSGCLRLLAPTPTGTPHARLTWTPGVNFHGVLAAEIEDVITDAADVDEHMQRTDVLLVDSGSPWNVGSTAQIGSDRIVVIESENWSGRSVLIDPAVHRPLGRRSDVVGSTIAASSLELPDWLDSTHVRALREVAAVTSTDALSSTVRAQLQAAGVVILNEASNPPPPEDHLGWQVASVQSRREVLRHHSPLPAVGDWPTVSVLLATHRPERLEHALLMITQQTYPYVQVIVAVHGDEPTTVDVRGLLEGWGGHWAIIGVPADRNLGQVLQEATDRAEGDLLTKMDDDDYYGAEHIWDLVLARMYSGAQIVGKALDYIHLAAQDCTVFRPTYRAEKYADFVAGGTILISRGDLASVGGWRPIAKSVDRALLDRVLAHGGLVYRTHGLGYVYVRHGATENTSRVLDDHFLTKTVATYPGLLAHVELGTTRPDDEPVEDQ